MIDESGSTTVENIVWLPVLLMILGAIVQFGLYFNAKIAVQAAAYEAARQAAVSDYPVDTAKQVASDFAKGTLPGWSSADRLVVNVDAPVSPKPGDKIDVAITYRVSTFLTGLLPGLTSADGLIGVHGASMTTLEERP